MRVERLEPVQKGRRRGRGREELLVSPFADGERMPAHPVPGDTARSLFRSEPGSDQPQKPAHAQKQGREKGRSHDQIENRDPPTAGSAVNAADVVAKPHDAVSQHQNGGERQDIPSHPRAQRTRHSRSREKDGQNHGRVHNPLTVATAIVLERHLDATQNSRGTRHERKAALETAFAQMPIQHDQLMPGGIFPISNGRLMSRQIQSPRSVDPGQIDTDSMPKLRIITGTKKPEVGVSSEPFPMPESTSSSQSLSPSPGRWCPRGEYNPCASNPSWTGSSGTLRRHRGAKELPHSVAP